ncbi:zinc finger protein 709-like [Hylaeus anthracinus]|uniref:zinc finger protein 709-like n=1 Tax=Hylaeus anthracinus TaxID=313031 RepID=UPI0023B8938E|nr:zinc finger protein 709-like [Hylaeus anthracinus]
MKLSQAFVETDTINTSSCRLCLRSEVCLTSIFTEGEASKCLRSRILDCCPVTLFEDNRLPQAICSVCKDQVAVTYQFREQCRKSERWLRSLYGSNCWSDEPRRIDTPNCKIVRDCGVQTDERTGASIHSEKEIDDNRNASRGETIVERPSRVSLIEKKERKEETLLATTRSTKRTVEGSGIVEEKRSRKDATVAHRSQQNTQESTMIEHVYSEELQFPEDTRISNSTHKDKDGNESSENRAKPTDGETGKPYLCDVCSKTFASKSGLRFHFKTHGGAKPHLCRHCGKGFAIPSYAKRHERTHVGDKRFVCHFCSAAFASSNGLKYHLMSHTGEPSYRCETCSKAFYRYKYLKEHIFTHTGEKPFVCKTCGFAYGNSGSLFVHEKKCKARLSRVNDEREATVEAPNRDTDFGD